MATTTQPSSAASTIKLWSREDFVEMYHKSSFGHMLSRGIAHTPDKLSKDNKGDEVTINLTDILMGIGKGEGQTMKGDEESLNRSVFQMTWNTFRHAVSNPGDSTIEQQRTTTPFEAQSRTLLGEFMMSRVDASCFNQLAGVYSTSITVDGTTYTGNDRSFVTGLNSVNAPSANRIIRAGDAASDEAITSADTFNLDMIDDALVLADNGIHKIRPLANGSYDLFLTPKQFLQLKRDSSGEIQWYKNALADAQGGNNKALKDVNFDSPQRFMGTYANVNIYTSTRVATGQHSSTSAAIPTVSRAVLCGKNALCFGSPNLKKGSKEVPLEYKTESDDYDEYKGIQAKTMYGAKKFVGFEGEDLGSITLPSYGA